MRTSWRRREVSGRSIVTCPDLFVVAGAAKGLCVSVPRARTASSLDDAPESATKGQDNRLVWCSARPTEWLTADGMTIPHYYPKL